MNRIILPEDTEIVVASYGGVGTTFLISYLSQYKKINHVQDADGVKHALLPPASMNSNVKFIYVYGNPQQAVISLFRRNFQYDQSKKLQEDHNTSFQPISKHMTLSEYALQGVDEFNFRNHFYNWYDKYLAACPTMFIRYETLFENLGKLFEFLELPKSKIATFPEKKNRTSNIDDIPVITRKQLNDMYGHFSDELELLDDVEIRQKKIPKIYGITYLKSPYTNVYDGLSMYEAKESLRKNMPKIFMVLRNIKKKLNGFR